MFRGKLTDYRIALIERVVETVPVYAKKDRGRKRPIGHKLKTVDVLACPLVWDPPQHVIDEENADYFLWSDAMQRLRDALDIARLSLHRLVSE